MVGNTPGDKPWALASDHTSMGQDNRMSPVEDHADMAPEVLPMEGHADMALEEMSIQTADPLQNGSRTYRPQTLQRCHLQHPALQMAWVT